MTKLEDALGYILSDVDGLPEADIRYLARMKMMIFPNLSEKT